MKRLTSLFALTIFVSSWFSVVGAESENYVMKTPSGTHVLGTICDEWDFHRHKCVENIDAFTTGTGDSVYFLSNLDVDADGGPHAYRPGNNGAFDYLANISKNDLHGIQGEAGAIGPAPGFYVSGTSFYFPAYKTNDTRHWVNAETIPYIVLPKNGFPLPNQKQPVLGCLAMVIDVKTGRKSGAIFAEDGHAVGEGSIALATGIGLRPFSTRDPPKVFGFEGKRFLYILFPDLALPKTLDAENIQKVALIGFSQWGGASQVAAIIPDAAPVQ